MKNLMQKMRASAAFGVAAALTVSVIGASNPQNVSATDGDSLGGCYDIEFIWARGSGSEMGAAEYAEFRQRIEQALTSSGFSGAANFYELGTAENGYPAQKVFELTPEGVQVLLDAKLSEGEEYAYGESVAAGEAELQAYLEERLAVCPRTYFALGGYSQGAQVIGDALVQLPQEIDTQVVYSVLYGDPKLYLPEGKGLDPAACRGKDLSPWRAHVPNCKANAGILGARVPYLQTFQVNKVASYCNLQDFVCGNPVDLTALYDHAAYIENGLYLDGAQRIVAAMRQVMPALFLDGSVSVSPNTLTPGQDVAILLDTTGSMDQQLLEFATTIKEIKRVSEQVLANGGRVALLEYRDVDSAFSENMPSRVLCDFADCTTEGMAELLDGLVADGGGNYDESMLHGVQNAFENLTWRNGASKALVIFTDAGFHDPDPTTGWTMTDAQRAALALDPVNIYIYKVFPYSGEPAKSHYDQMTQQKMLSVRTAGDATDNGNGQKGVAQMLDEMMERPIARLSSSSYAEKKGRSITFDATGSTGVSAELAYADWDMEGDGIFDILGAEQGLASLRLDYTYTTVGSGYMQVRVVDRNGLSNTASAQYTISENENWSDIWVNAWVQTDALLNDYLKINWTGVSNATRYRLYINDVHYKDFDKNAARTISIYSMDLTKDIKVQVRPTISGTTREAMYVIVHAPKPVVEEPVVEPEPTEPEPSEPVEPTEPEPSEPVEPTEPSEPFEPTEPVEPVESEPSEPDPTPVTPEPIEPSMPVEPELPSGPVEPSEPVEPEPETNEPEPTPEVSEPSVPAEPETEHTEPATPIVTEVVSEPDAEHTETPGPAVTTQSASAKAYGLDEQLQNSTETQQETSDGSDETDKFSDIEVPDAVLTAEKQSSGLRYIWAIVGAWAVLLLGALWWIVLGKRRKNKEGNKR
ncbi:MAG: cutinase family protein [Candidatus Nomurabacteria bacterium]|jgi:hypothetical protein|nr:cutinase family protein [Candidatus Nomurabacteria bacterium]